MDPYPLFPPAIAALLAGQDYRPDTVGMSRSRVLLYDHMVLKLQPISPEAENEYKLLTFLRGRLPVPQVLAYERQEGNAWLLMSRAQGQMACRGGWLDRPEALAQALAGALKALWAVDTAPLTAPLTLDAKLELARARVEQGRVSLAYAEPETFGPGGFESPQTLLDWLVEHRPEEELVLSHGDFCLPNLLLCPDGSVSAYIDLGRGGVSDRYQDIALCWRSLRDNLAGEYGGPSHPGHPDLLFEALGMEKDEERLRYYLLLDELF